MKIRTLDGPRLHRGFSAGANSIRARQGILNSMNVFPVPDGDTGTNLSATVQSVSEGAVVSRSLSQTSASMADAALTGARGNSGLIFAQFLWGFSQGTEGLDELDVAAFGRAVSGAVPYAREALSKPVEGTILTVMEDWASEVAALSRRYDDFAHILPGSLETARRSLGETPSKLPVLAKAGVLDAGGQGFVDFLEGIVSFLESGDLRDLTLLSGAPTIRHTHENFRNGEPAFRYCTEALLQGRGMDIGSIRADMQPFGDSLIVGGHGEKVRVHIHTDTPDRLFFTIKKHGSLTQQKADDMRRQVDVCRNRMHSVALVTDSTCDLPQECLDRNQVHVVPLRLAFGESVYLDRVTLSSDQFYTLLEGNGESPVSSQPPMSDFERTYRFLLEHYDSVIAMHISSKLSGTWNASRAAAEKVGGKITVIDSRTASAPLGLLVMRAAEALNEGKGHDEAVSLVEKSIPGAKIFISLRTLKNMVRGGRISPVKGFLASALNLKPIVFVDEEGYARSLGQTRGWERNVEKIRDIIDQERQKAPIWKYAIVHAHSPASADIAASGLAEIVGREPTYVMDICPVLGAHTGLGSVAVGLLAE
ncbi:MAG TPA: DegV family protein [Synergistales bacterium]|nr:DegV family protein [Synergistales bacterium]